jgi:carbonic anhydrase
VLVSLVLLSTEAGANAQDSQSPIDITSAATVFDANLPALDFDYQTTSLSVINNGSPGVESTIRANVPGGAGSVTVSGTEYNLLQFHFHHPSEHLLNGHESAMEMHLVHQDAVGNYLVVGRFIEPGDPNTLLDPIFSNLPPDESAPALVVDNFDLGGLLPGVLTSYRYDGSLTTSPYTEGVQWVMLSEVLELSPTQIAAFVGLFDGPEGNHREPQALNGRSIHTDVEGFAAVPDTESMTALFCLSLLGIAMVRRGIRAS